MSPQVVEILRLALDGLIVAGLIGLLVYYVRRTRRRPAAVDEEQRQAAEMLDIPPPTEPR